MEEIVEGLGRLIFRTIKWILIEVFIEIFIYGYGYVTLKVVTLGRYPKSGRDDETICIIAGIVSIVLTLFLIAYIYRQ